jgi:ABC-type cobalamin/Fe3+-siderophores transport system ATPase subunit
MTSSAVEATDLVKHFGDTVAVDGVSFSVPEGSVLGLLGPNGAGKTTTVRMLIHIRRMPEMLMDVTIQPVMFVLLFAFVFGSSIDIPGVSYREFLVPGIMAQTMAFSAFIVAMDLTSDLQKGIVDRFR